MDIDHAHRIAAREKDSPRSGTSGRLQIKYPGDTRDTDVPDSGFRPLRHRAKMKTARESKIREIIMICQKN